MSEMHGADQQVFQVAVTLPLLLAGAGEGTRTPDPCITNALLYQLSYAGTSGIDRLPSRRTQSPFHGKMLTGAVRLGAMALRRTPGIDLPFGQRRSNFHMLRSQTWTRDPIRK